MERWGATGKRLGTLDSERGFGRVYRVDALVSVGERLGALGVGRLPPEIPGSKSKSEHTHIGTLWEVALGTVQEN